MKTFDCHTHTNCSLDGKQTIDELCKSAIEKGVLGVAVTDHADMWF
ncbi:MAG: PHP domain-containing protein [Clostridia bacterium]|nr:PHP domain-containing protein [Clostridia bacterium]